MFITNFDVNMRAITRKFESNPDDYVKAAEIVSDLKLLHSMTIEVSEKKNFRKYLSDLAVKERKQFTTRSKPDGLMIVRIK